TIAIPTRNREALLERALASALGQDYANVEIVVSDNASSDGTAAYLGSVSDPRVRRYRQETLIPLPENWDFCLHQARGDFLLVLSDDDHLLPRAVSSLVALYDRHPSLELAYGRVRVDDSTGIWEASTESTGPAFEPGADLVEGFFRWKRTVLPSAALFRTGSLARNGGFSRGGLKLGVDILAWACAVLPDHDAACSEDILAVYNFHGESVSNKVPPAVWVEDFDRLIGEIRKQYGPGNHASLKRIERAWKAYRLMPHLNSLLRRSGNRTPYLVRLARFTVLFPRFAVLGAGREALGRGARGLLPGWAFSPLRRAYLLLSSRPRRGRSRA
ncbi:MAG TPA: glycosyltransferase family A protein, partial [Deinococcales bacterium]|nr:glycosyltransferase family A protein [Deinococcales bacterium]